MHLLDDFYLRSGCLGKDTGGFNRLRLGAANDMAQCQRPRQAACLSRPLGTSFRKPPLRNGNSRIYSDLGVGNVESMHGNRSPKGHGKGIDTLTMRYDREMTDFLDLPDVRPEYRSTVAPAEYCAR
ncbi:hypothetical protein SAMN05421750_101678 [Agrobacterium pusense]|nr:hypothetical protein SAMN05421750_101678 [Agrobacterium pusense]